MVGKQIAAIVLGVCAFAAGALTSQAAPGDLDPTFGFGGAISTSITAGDDTALAVAQQTDGKLVAVGQARLGASYDFAIARYLSNGALDRTFGGTGVVSTPIDQGTDIPHGLVIQPDGKLLAAGWAFITGHVHNFAVVRYLPSGALDPAWGGTGKVTTNIGPAAKSDDAPYAIIRQADGRIVVAGETFDPVSQRVDVALVRYLENGVLDASFGTGGIVVTPLGLGGSARAVLQQADGRIVAAGLATFADGFHPTLVRYLANGSLDASFGQGGVAVTRAGVEEGVAWEVVQQANGTLVLAGEAYDADTQTTDFMLARYSASGALDSSFGQGGVVVTPIGINSAARALVLQNGRLVAAGSSSPAGTQEVFTLARYDLAGDLDPTFGQGGIVRTAINSRSGARALALQQDGRLVAGGYAFFNGRGNDFVLVRYLAESLGSTTSTSSSTTSSTAASSSSSTSSTTTTTSSSTTVTTIGGEVIEVSFRSIGGEDGTVVESFETSNVGGLVPPIDGDVQVGDQASNDRQFKGILSFDTSAIPDGAVVVSATLRIRRVGLFGTNPFTVLGACGIDVRTGGFGGNVALQASDFEAPATVAAAGTLGNAPANGDVSVGTLGAAGRAAINRTGRTQLRLAFALDDNDNAVADRIRYASGDQADPSLRPELVVQFQ
jgi:uncharacterized delta-60 repeat protein